MKLFLCALRSFRSEAPGCEATPTRCQITASSEARANTPDFIIHLTTTVISQLSSPSPRRAFLRRRLPDASSSLALQGNPGSPSHLSSCLKTQVRNFSPLCSISCDDEFVLISSDPRREYISFSRFYQMGCSLSVTDWDQFSGKILRTLLQT